MVIKPWLVKIIPSFHHNFHFFHKLSLNKYHSTSPFHRDFKSHNLKCASVCNTITSQFKQNLTLVCFFNHVPNSYHLLTQYSGALTNIHGIVWLHHRLSCMWFLASNSLPKCIGMRSGTIHYNMPCIQDLCIAKVTNLYALMILVLKLHRTSSKFQSFHNQVANLITILLIEELYWLQTYTSDVILDWKKGLCL